MPMRDRPLGLDIVGGATLSVRSRRLGRALEPLLRAMSDYGSRLSLQAHWHIFNARERVSRASHHFW